ncbi:DUF4856 domain-containing protein [Larkinella terrae]|uniref:DUF4856 domain-containing protein n=1 Tax=Larkinella terrae TaxID=2025311 RepID=A0A7K0EI50_9BACT|nr:DUF4856 domain-containing protein [Larkinella terrae]MRS61503.1 DUF4856 domain-containing protein [Larkinella terrae]
MFKSHLVSRILPVVVLAASLIACNKDDDDNTITPPDNLRTAIDYSKLTDTTTYASYFADINKVKTVDMTPASTQLLMFRAINTYNGTAVGTGATLDSTVLKNMFANTGNAFTDAALNSSGVNLRSIFASSLPTAEAEKERKTLESAFAAMALTSKAVSQTAAEGKAGKLTTGTSNYLVDAKGIEWAQIIQKSMIGGLQVDYISNVLLSDKNLALDNSKVVSGKSYTALEHNWDQIYGLLTANPVYGAKATATSSGESFLGSYLWEYNKEDFPKIHMALLKGRAAIVNNDPTTLKAQVAIIRPALEKAIAGAALGYLGKWKTNATNDAARAHAMGEGLGFIYSLRYGKVNGGDATFSDTILAGLVGTAPNGFWGLTNAKIDAADAAIRAKFKIAN